MKPEDIKKLRDAYNRISKPSERLQDLMERMEDALDVLDPEKLRGRDGESPEIDEDSLVRKVLSRIRVPRDGRDGASAREIDYETVTKHLLGRIKGRKTDLSIFDLRDWQDLYRAPGNVIAAQAGNGNGTGTPSAPDFSIQYNNNGAFFGDPLATRNPSTHETHVAAQWGNGLFEYANEPSFFGGVPFTGVKLSNSVTNQVAIRGVADVSSFMGSPISILDAIFSPTYQYFGQVDDFGISMRWQDNSNVGPFINGSTGGVSVGWNNGMSDVQFGVDGGVGDPYWGDTGTKYFLPVGTNPNVNDVLTVVNVSGGGSQVFLDFAAGTGGLSGYTLGTSTFNTALGIGTAASSVGQHNTWIGGASGGSVGSGDENVVVGYRGAWGATTINNNVIVGNTTLFPGTLDDSVIIGNGITLNTNAADVYIFGRNVGSFSSHDVYLTNAITGNIAIGAEKLTVGQSTGIFYRYDNSANTLVIKDYVTSADPDFSINTGIYYQGASGASPLGLNIGLTFDLYDYAPTSLFQQRFGEYAFGDPASIRITQSRLYQQTQVSGIVYGENPSITFTGGGLDDMTYPANNSWQGSTTETIRVVIDSTGTPDTFAWYVNGVLMDFNVPISGGSQGLIDSNGNSCVQVDFGATTGHSMGDYWQFDMVPAMASALTLDWGVRQASLGIWNGQFNATGILVQDIPGKIYYSGTPINPLVWEAVDTNHTFIHNEYQVIMQPVGASLTCYLPATPNHGETYVVSDGTGTAATHNITIDGNGHNIRGSGAFTMAANWESVTFVYQNPDGVNKQWIAMVSN